MEVYGMRRDEEMKDRTVTETRSVCRRSNGIHIVCLDPVFDHVSTYKWKMETTSIGRRRSQVVGHTMSYSTLGRGS